MKAQPFLNSFVKSTCAALLGAVLLSAAHIAPAQQFTFRQYGQQDGLTNLSVACLLQDGAGYIWMCTENGLFRHDGATFERFGNKEGLTDTNIHSALEDAAARLWVGTSGDLYLRQGGRFVAVRPEGHNLSIDSGARMAALPSGALLVIDKEQLQQLQQSVADGMWHGRGYFTPEQLQATPALQHLSSVYADPSGRLWLGCGESICSVEHGQLTVWDAKANVPKDNWHSWLIDGDGRLWARGLEHVLTLEPRATRFDSRDTPQGKLTAGVLNVPLVTDQQGRIVTRSDAGLMRWQNGHWQQLTAENGITISQISALLVGRDGALWLGMTGHGLWRWLGYGSFESWTPGQASGGNPVWVVLRGPNHAVLIGTRAGCYRIDAASGPATDCGFKGLPSGEIQVMATRADGSLWIGMATGQLLRIAPGQKQAVLIGTVPFMRKLYADSNDRLWICSSKGIWVVATGSNVIDTTATPPGLGEITDVVEGAQSAVWFATEGGLLRWLNGDWSLLPAAEAQAPGGFAAVAYAGDGWLWLAGASHGLMRVHTRGTRFDQARWITDPAVADAAGYFTQIDAHGWLWVGTDAGFALFDGKSWRRFGQQDGLIWNDTDENAVLADSDGSMWIGTSGGLTHILKPEQLLQSAPLDLRIGRAALGSALIDPGTAALQWQHGAALDVHLAEFDFGEPHAQLSVRLRGLSDDWFQTSNHDLHFPALAPGHYVFEARALDLDHQRSSAVVRLDFQITPPWWQSWWCRLLMLATGAALLLLLVNWRLRRLKAQRRALEKELKEREILLERATRDALTRLWNRSAIFEILEREMQTARQLSTPLAIALIDIDHFKRVNDTHGHQAGDEVLRTLGARLSVELRNGDALGRYGGEELLLVLPNASPQTPFQPLERLRQAIGSTPISHKSCLIKVTASFGVAWFVPAADRIENLIGRADAALYEAKFGGRDRVEYAATGS